MIAFFFLVVDLKSVNIVRFNSPRLGDDECIFCIVGQFIGLCIAHAQARLSGWAYKRATRKGSFLGREFAWLLGEGSMFGFVGMRMTFERSYLWTSLICYVASIASRQTFHGLTLRQCLQ